jgi:DtxR family Mn-dependent transcriptional regulator
MLPTLTIAEEHYLKAIFLLAEKEPAHDYWVPVKALAAQLGATQPSVLEMLRRLQAKGLLHYAPYQGITLKKEGRKAALKTLRIQRLWEVFLVEKLKMKWDEVHEATEELEHVRSEKVIALLDDFLGHPQFDPHGDPIPDPRGVLHKKKSIPLSTAQVGGTYILTGVTEHSPAFLQHLENFKLSIGVPFVVSERLPFDGSLIIELGGVQHTLSSRAAENILVAEGKVAGSI